MKQSGLPGLLAVLAPLLLSGCDPGGRAEVKAVQSANAYCAREGKQPFILDRQHSGDALVGGTATVAMVCVDPSDVVRTADSFGVQVLASGAIQGAEVLSVTPGSIADKAGIKIRDVIYEYDGAAIGTAAALRSAVAATPGGKPVEVKLMRHRVGVVTSVQF